MSGQTGITVRDGAVFASLRREVRQAARTALMQAGAQGQAELREKLSVPGGGKPSAPGEAPRKQTGTLAGAMVWAVSDAGDGPSLAIGDIAGQAPYAAALESGTARMKPRPFLDGLAARAAQIWARAFSALLKGDR